MAKSMKRSRLLVDPAFQVRLLVRVVAYVLIYFVLVFFISFVLVAIYRTIDLEVEKSFGQLLIDFILEQRGLLLTLLVVAPVWLYDLLKFSNRIAGPLFRCRQVMLEMARGKIVPEFKPRKGDFMTEFFAAFNELIRECNSRVAAKTESTVEPTVEKSASTVEKQAPALTA